MKPIMKRHMWTYEKTQLRSLQVKFFKYQGDFTVKKLHLQVKLSIVLPYLDPTRKYNMTYQCVSRCDWFVLHYFFADWTCVRISLTNNCNWVYEVFIGPFVQLCTPVTHQFCCCLLEIGEGLVENQTLPQ